MKQTKIPSCLLYGLLLVSVWLLPSMAFAQGTTQVTKGDAVAGEGLTVVNSIVWDNLFENKQLFANNNNLVNEDPLFVSQTDFLPGEGSPALGKGNGTKNTLGIDIAGVPYTGATINIGAFQSGASYTVTITTPSEGGTLMVYKGSTAIKSDGDPLTSGTELIVSAIPATGYRLKELTANGNPITNGASFFLTANTTFAAVFEGGSIRGEKYATYASGGSLNVFNTIIYDNLDEYGNYSLDKTNVIADPEFLSATDFALKDISPALNRGDAGKLPVEGLSDLAGKEIGTGIIDAGAFQNSDYQLSWQVTPSAGGTLTVYYTVRNEADQLIKAKATNGYTYPGGTVYIEIVTNPGYILKELKAGDILITVEDGKGSFTLSADIVITATFQPLSGEGITVKAAVFQGGTLELLNNIIYGNAADITTACNLFGDNLPIAANLGGESGANNLLDIDPLFMDETNYKLRVNSPAINMGKYEDFDVDSKDVAGETRIVGLLDMGAYESAVEFTGYGVSFGWTDLKDEKGKVYAEIKVIATPENGDPEVVAPGDKFPAGTEITIEVKVLDEFAEQYECLGEIRVNDDYLGEGVYSFILEEDSKVYHNIQKKKYPVHYDAPGGAIRLYNGSTLLSDGDLVPYGTRLSVVATADENYETQFVSVNGVQIVGAEEAGGYIITVTGETTIVVSAIDETLVGTYGLIVWDVLNATVTATVDGEPVNSGDALPVGTEVEVTVAPTDPDYGFFLFQVNGVDQDLATTTFTVTIPEMNEEDGKVPTTFIAVRYGEGGRLADDPTEPNPADPDPVYVTMVIPDNLPEGITMNPGPGTYQVLEGSSQLLKLLIDEQYDDYYVFLKINGDYVMVKPPVGLLEFSYLLMDIQEALNIEVVVSLTSDPEEGDKPTGNAELADGKINVVVESGKLKVESGKAVDVQVYSIAGKLVARRVVNGTEYFEVSAGAYIVRSTSETIKIMVNY